jgi:hypothetical protein
MMKNATKMAKENGIDSVDYFERRRKYNRKDAPHAVFCRESNELIHKLTRLIDVNLSCDEKKEELASFQQYKESLGMLMRNCDVECLRNLVFELIALYECGCPETCVGELHEMVDYWECVHFASVQACRIHD